MDITTFDGPVAQRGVGVVAPFDFALDRELWRWTPDEVSLHLTRTPFVPVEVSVDMARLISEHETLQNAVAALDSVRPVSYVYACTSGSFVGGIRQERAMCASMSGAGRGMPSATTSGALLEALAELGARRMTVVTPYTKSLTDSLEDYLAEAGIEVAGREYMGLTGQIWEVSYRSVVDLARAAHLEDTDCLFISCTNLPTYDVIPQLEAELRIPVLSANQVTMWSALRQAGAEPVGDYQSLIDPAARASLATYRGSRPAPRERSQDKAARADFPGCSPEPAPE
ncbi:decarboxylase [Streptomyces sp900116325]|uniref:maleate cis-trans isomerase family protein n=1 Tax=Streptomyces sp. 900116325 TaxID=3154295 RepID=UPI00332B12B5